MAEVPQSSRSIQQLLDEISPLASAGIDSETFYAEVSGRIASVIPAVGVAVWIPKDDSIALLTHSGFDVHAELASDSDREQHIKLLADVARRGQARLVRPGDGELENRSNNLLAILPIRDGRVIRSVLEVALPPKLGQAEQQTTLRVLSAVANVATNFHRVHELRQLRDEQSWWKDLNAFSAAIHSSLNPTKTAYLIANEARRAIGCDRVTVVERRVGEPHILAISGQEEVNRRANSVRLLERVAAGVFQRGEPMCYPNGNTESSSADDQLRAYLDEADARSVSVMPLKDPSAMASRTAGGHSPAGPILGALVVEQFTDNELPTERIELIGEHAAKAMRNVAEHHSVFLLPLWSTVGKAAWIVRGRNLRTTTKVVVALLVVLLVLFIVPARFKVAAEGTLQPEDKSFVFAGVDGVVEQLHVRHGSDVEQDDPLLDLRSSDLQIQRQEVEGQILSTEKRLHAIRSMRKSTPVPGTNSRPGASNLGADELDLQESLASLKQQRRLLTEKINQLEVKSPMGGRVITWDVESALMARPVVRGQRLLTVANVEGPWVVELMVPNHRIKHLVEARRDSKEPLPVSYILATDPGRKLRGTVKSLAQATTLDPTQGPMLKVTVEIEEADVDQLYAGAKVSGRIACSRRSLGYVWLVDVIEFFQSRVLFSL